MKVYLNGQIVPEDQARVSVFDRGFLYGDGLFETLRVANGRPFRWAPHFNRLQRGADCLRLALPFSAEQARELAGELIAQNEMPDGLLRLAVSRGCGPRGYSIRGAEQPSVAMSLHPLPSIAAAGQGWRLWTAGLQLPANDPLAQFKTCNKLPQILARSEAEAAGADEALLANTEGYLVEAASGNLFWVAGDSVATAPIAAGILPGVTRGVVWELCERLGLSCQEAKIRAEELRTMQGVFLTLSSLGIVAGVSLDGQPLPTSPIVSRLQEAYGGLLEAETR